MLKALRQRKERRRLADSLGDRLSHQARDPAFYADCGVSDTFDGRFDLLVLHGWMVLQVLRSLGEGMLAQALIDSLFTRLDDALREQGAGDMSMSRRMKTMAGAFYGRLSAYDAAPDEAAMAGALLRNVYRGQDDRIEQAARLAKYVADARARLVQSRLTEGEADFGPVPKQQR
ncbi:MAG TPA: ubiquinol-cytochrome C chaperone family protein [Rhizomicrobium sp.]|jgi:cytochrome b pre-mRNA-processing protein 3|nr:ubiquinol-cytochrome C chaperone family protein [Rhizomicrobium sp.]